MKKSIAFCIFLGLMAACSPAAPAAQTGQPETEEPSPVVEATATVIVPTVEEPTIEPTAEVADPTATMEVTEVDSCLECHSEKDQLVAVAEPEQEVISESKGEG
ncbi:MAG: hypothetical protein R3335_03220 [Anaerolineales bacterium]|nr:hypothetical protein [Anaerolineales bacterium]